MVKQKVRMQMQISNFRGIVPNEQNMISVQRRRTKLTLENEEDENVCKQIFFDRFQNF